MQVVGREIHLLDYVRVLRKRAWMAGAVAAAVFVAGVLITVRQPRVYKAVARIEITNERNTVVPYQNVVPSSAESYWGLAYYLQTQYRIIASRGIAERAVALLKTENKAGPELGGSDPASVLMGMVTVEPIPDCHLVDVGILHTDAQKATDYSNALVRAYIEESRSRRLEEIKEAVTWLSNQLKAYKEKKQEFDEKILAFKKKHDIVNLADRQTAATQKLRERLTDWHAAQSVRAQAEGEWKKLDELAKSTADRKTLASVLKSDVLGSLVLELEKLDQEKARLEVKYKAKHPDLVRVDSERAATIGRIDAEVSRQVDAKHATWQLAKAKEDALAREVDRAKDEALDVEQRLISFNTMLSESETAEKFYASLDQRFNEADLTSLFQKDNIHVVDAARLPGAPIRPRVPLNLALALGAGLLAGIGSAFFLEYLDRSVKGPEDVEVATGVAFLGFIPQAGHELEALREPRSHVAEACRTVRTNILFAKPDDPVKRLLVTSAAPGEGKSTTVVNLGIVLAAGGQRTLLVDTDLRRPRLHTIFGLKNERGMTNLVVGDGKAEDLIVETIAPNLFLLPSGPIPPNPAELLGSASFHAVVKELSAKWDRIVFDSPPVIAVTDPAVLSASVDGVVLVARAGGTARDLLAAARRRLSDVRAPLVGVILNALEMEKAGGTYPYYYAHYYGQNGNGRTNGAREGVHGDAPEEPGVRAARD